MAREMVSSLKSRQQRLLGKIRQSRSDIRNFEARLSVVQRKLKRR